MVMVYVNMTNRSQDLYWIVFLHNSVIIISFATQIQIIILQFPIRIQIFYCNLLFPHLCSCLHTTGLLINLTSSFKHSTQANFFSNYAQLSMSFGHANQCYLIGNNNTFLYFYLHMVKFLKYRRGWDSIYLFYFKE